MQTFDAVIVGAGAAGLFCAGVAAQRGRQVLLLDHSPRVAEKIRISGGGRCNFTNRDVSAANFISENPRFCVSALTRYTSSDFIKLVESHGIAYHEKHKGQLFCDHSADDIIQMLLRLCQTGGVMRWQPCGVRAVRRVAPVGSDTNPDASGIRYELDTDQGTVITRSVVVATGGLAIPKMGATDWGYALARQFGLRIVTPTPALVPLTFDANAWAPYASLAGLSLPVQIETGSKKSKAGGRALFAEDLLFTHRGLSGPAVLQISSYWQSGTPIRLNLAPQCDWSDYLNQAKLRSRKLVANELAAQLPARLADTWVAQDVAWQRPIDQATDKALAALALRLSAWEITPTGTEGYAKAEVTRGGVDTRDLSSQTLESRVPGLYFIGEVVDVTGWLGGYNFQWAWSSAHACGTAL